MAKKKQAREQTVTVLPCGCIEGAQSRPNCPVHRGGLAVADSAAPLQEVIEHLEYTLALARRALGPETTSYKLLGEAFAYSFSVIGKKRGPFSRIEAQTLMQQAYLAGVARCKDR